MYRSSCFMLSVLWTTLFATICAQPFSNSIQLGNPANGVDIIVPPSMTQCESFVVYYNITNTISPRPFIAFYRSDVIGDALLTLLPPTPAVGYIDWTCNIPAGHSLVVAVRTDNVATMLYNSGTLRGQSYIVRSSDSSSCLADLTTTYSVANYGTEFRFYTLASVEYGPPRITYEPGTTTRFPTTPLPTISANPGLIAISTSTMLRSSSATFTSAPISTTPTVAPASPRPKEAKQNIIVAIVLSVIGTMLVVGIVVILWVRRLRRSIESTVYGRAGSLEIDLLALPSSSRDPDDGDLEHTVPTRGVHMSSYRPIPMQSRTDIDTGSHNTATSLETQLSQLTNLQRQTVFAHLAATDTRSDITSGSLMSLPPHHRISSSSIPRPDPSPNMEAIPDTVSILSSAEARALSAYIRRIYDVDQSTPVGTAWGEKPSLDESPPPYGT